MGLREDSPPGRGRGGNDRLAGARGGWTRPVGRVQATRGVGCEPGCYSVGVDCRGEEVRRTVPLRSLGSMAVPQALRELDCHSASQCTNGFCRA